MSSDLDFIPVGDLDGDPGPERPPDDALQAHPGELTFAQRLRTIRAFCDEEREPPETLLGPWKVGQRLVLAAETGRGKSTLATQVGRAVSTGEVCLGWKGRGDCRGLILDAEQGGLTLERRFRSMGMAECEDLDILPVPDGASLDQRKIERVWLEEVLEAGQYAFVIADPLYKLFRGNSNEERDAVEFMRWWDRWRLGAPGRWPAFGLLMPMHARKPLPKQRFSMADIFGSGAWVRGCEVVFGLQFLNPGYSQLHFWKDRDGWGEELGEVEGFRTGDTWGLTFTREDAFQRGAKVGGETTPDAIVRLVNEVPLTVEALCEAIPGRNGKPPAARTTIERALKKLGGLVASVGQTADGHKLWGPGPESAPMAPSEDELEHYETLAARELRP